MQMHNKCLQFKKLIMNKKIARSRTPFFLAVFVGLTTLFLISCTTEQAPAVPEYPSPDEAKAAILEKINAENDLWAAGDPMGFLENAAQDISWVDDIQAQHPVQGYEALKTYLESLKGMIPPHEHELQEMAFQNYGDIVVVTYRYQGSMDGQPVPPWKATSVYRYSDGDWKSVHENWSLDTSNMPE
jgi:ketosteroid isomerase-like protein